MNIKQIVYESHEIKYMIGKINGLIKSLENMKKVSCDYQKMMIDTLGDIAQSIDMCVDNIVEQAFDNIDKPENESDYDDEPQNDV